MPFYRFLSSEQSKKFRLWRGTKDALLHGYRGYREELFSVIIFEPLKILPIRVCDHLWTKVNNSTRKRFPLVKRGEEGEKSSKFRPTARSSPNLSKSCDNLDDKVLHDSVPEMREETRGAEVWMRLEACSDASSRGPPSSCQHLWRNFTPPHGFAATPSALLSLNSFRTINILASHNPFNRSPRASQWGSMNGGFIHRRYVYIARSCEDLERKIFKYSTDSNCSWLDPKNVIFPRPPALLKYLINGRGLREISRKWLSIVRERK